MLVAATGAGAETTLAGRAALVTDGSGGFGAEVGAGVGPAGFASGTGAAGFGAGGVTTGGFVVDCARNGNGQTASADANATLENIRQPHAFRTPGRSFGLAQPTVIPLLLCVFARKVNG